MKMDTHIFSKLKRLTRWAFSCAVIVWALGLASGCTLPNAPPSMSFSKYVRAPGGAEGSAESRGAVGFSTGVAIMGIERTSSEASDDKYDNSFYLFPVEGSVSNWFHDVYDLTFTVNSAMFGHLEGNLAPVDTGRFRLGILHGLGLGLWVDMADGEDEESDGVFFYGFSAGAVAQVQTTANGVFLVGVKYMYSGTDEINDEDGENDYTHYVASSIGHMFTVGDLRITPELLVLYGNWNPQYGDGEGEEQSVDIWVILPSLTFAAGF